MNTTEIIETTESVPFETTPFMAEESRPSTAASE